MKSGDLVRGWCQETTLGEQVGIVIEIVRTHPGMELIPPAARVLWASGEIGKEWTDDVEVISES